MGRGLPGGGTPAPTRIIPADGGGRVPTTPLDYGVGAGRVSLAGRTNSEAKGRNAIFRKLSPGVRHAPYSPALFHNSSTRRFTSAGISITPGHGLVNPSPGHLRVASTPIFEP